jgi:hypothetical protein
VVVKEFYNTREDGVDLYLTMDAKVDENGNPLRDEKGKLIPTGFKIQKYVVTWNGKRIKKDEPYAVAIDVADKPYEYEPTEIPIVPTQSDEYSALLAYQRTEVSR